MEPDSSGNMPTDYFHSHTTVNPQLSILYGSLFTLLIILIIGSSVYFWWRRRTYQWRRRKRPHAISATSLSKVTLQYITNPNYYSNSPDNLFLRMLQDLEIPGESLTFTKIVGEGCYSKVYKVMVLGDSFSKFHTILAVGSEDTEVLVIWCLSGKPKYIFILPQSEGLAWGIVLILEMKTTKLV
ncbi:uncharacterized protein LOC143228325 [Tachypleus tridentatus]|uniref:uncharacterized protein LOC143228325 n=1 Tax=Tachypleus tridentatus TaxID=6853 RepID=UPI003FD493FF